MTDRYIQKLPDDKWLKPVCIGLGLSILTLMFLLAGRLAKIEPVYAGDNIWTWDKLIGNAETLLSNPLNPGIVYAVLDNRRLYQTTDGGVTWSQMPDLPHGGVSMNMRLAPDNASILFLWGNDSGKFLVRSVDGGNTWQDLSKAGEIAISPASWKEIYLSSEGSLFKSTDGGDTWVEISQFTPTCPSPIDLAIAPSAPQIMISIFNPPSSMDFYLCKTVDSGRTWSPLSFSSPVIHAVVFDPKNSNTIYLATTGGGWKSTDGGINWEPIANGLNNPAQFVIDPDNTQVIHAADLNQAGGVFESQDGGVSWTLINTGIQGLSVRTIAIGGRDPLKIYAGVMNSGVWEITRTDLQDYSITVNNGALFTNQTAVTLTLTAPPGTSQMMLSDDGGFGGAAWEAFLNTRPFTITAYGNYVLPRTVFAKFRTNGQISGLYQDDIVLDPNPPTGTVQITDTLSTPLTTAYFQDVVRSTTAPLSNTAYLPVVSRNYLPGHRLVGLVFSATDDLSGVESILISNEATFAGAEWLPFVKSKTWYVLENGTTTVYVKYRDRAGNESQVCSAATTAP